MPTCFDISRLSATRVQSDPYPHLIVPGFVPAEICEDVAADYPKIDHPGSFPLKGLEYGSKFGALMAELTGAEMTALIAQKFDIDLDGKPTLVTVRAHSRPRDGKIHTDSPPKLITMLLYMNGDWQSPGGRLRLLRNNTDLENYAAIVPPDDGTLLIFKNGPT